MLRASIRNGIKTVYLHAINFKMIIRMMSVYKFST